MRSIKRDERLRTPNELPDAEITMNTLITSACLSPLITTVILGVLGMSCGAVSVAADGSDLPQVIVKFSDLNLAAPQGAAALYARIAAAADKACQSYTVDSRDLVGQEAVRRCVHKAIADAVIKVRQPRLLALYNAKNRRTVAIPPALARAR